MKPALKIGNFITLGHYEQDGNKNNGSEAIEWQVLTVEDGRALVFSNMVWTRNRIMKNGQV